jgi:cyclophilin family peptidyl-prolyl cis-trans isomerase
VSLARGGFYDGLKFSRVVPGFFARTGDPVGDGSGGPGYQIEAEFNNRPHLRGVLSMAREGDPMESQGAMPRPEFANTAGSQFFVALNYDKTQRLDNRYTAFGKLIGDESIETLRKIGGGAIADAASNRPAEPVTITRLEIVPVTPETNPYLTLMSQAQIADEQAAPAKPEEPAVK